jgi:hypothetical protein
MQKYGIQNTLEVAKFADALVQAGKEIKARGIKLTGANLFKLLPYVLPALGTAEDAFEGIAEVPKELGELSRAEKNELFALIDDGVALKDKTKEAIVERLIKALVESADAVSELLGKSPAESEEDAPASPKTYGNRRREFDDEDAG